MLSLGFSHTLMSTVCSQLRVLADTDAIVLIRDEGR